MMTETELPSLMAKVRPYHNQNPQGNSELLGFADLIIGGAFVIKDIRIVKSLAESGKQPFVSFPSKKGRGTGMGEAKYFDIAHPITADAYRAACELILRAYQEAEAAVAVHS